MLPKSNRIILPSDFYKLKKFGKRFSNQYFSISVVKESNLETPIFSVIVSKMIAKKSTQRNKLKRLAKSLIIKNRLKLPSNIKCLVFPKPSILTVKYSDLETEFLNLFNQI